MCSRHQALRSTDGHNRMNQSKVFELEFLSQTGRFTSCLAQLGEKCDLHFRHAFFQLIRPVPFQKTIQTHSQTSSSILSAVSLSPDSPPPKGIVQRYTRRNSVTSAPAAIQNSRNTHNNICSTCGGDQRWLERTCNGMRLWRCWMLDACDVTFSPIRVNIATG